MYGYAGKIARIDLATKKITIEETPKSWIKEYLGGRGFASKILFDEVPPEVDAFSPENKLIFAVGPLAGTVWPTGSRYTVAAKSPLSDGLGYAHSGGFFGPELKFAGFDMLIFESKSNKPVYAWVHDGTIDLLDASHLWGKDVWEVTKILQSDHDKAAKVAAIGPAGENLVRIAAVINDEGRAAARTGMAAVMGSKKLKAIVARGKQNVEIADRDKFMAKVKEVTEKIRKNPGAQTYGQFGTSILVNFKLHKGDLPAKNHQYGNMPYSENVGGELLSKTILKKPKSCYACPIHCGRVVEVDGIVFEGMEYETIDALGPMLWINDLKAVARANILANKLGLDTISAGVTIAFAMELVDRGIVSKDEVGVNLEWGNEQAVLEMLEMISYRKGFGDILAEGAYRAAQKIGKGAEKYAMTIKKVELPRQEPRATKGFGLAHATSNRGADHLYGLPTLAVAHNVDAAKKLFPEADIEELLNPRSPYYKPEMLVISEHFCAISDAVSICKFTTSETWAIMPGDVAEGLTYLTGIEFTREIILEIGERIINLERAYNVRAGFSRKDDYQPERILKEPLRIYDPKDYSKVIEIGPYKGEGPQVEMDELLDHYYELRNWDKSTGYPTKKKLQELGLDYVIEDLEKRGISLP